jgi:SAM-dependent methyltransferase
VGYLDWHAKPGYYADITRHFDRDAEILDVGCGTAWLAEHFPNYTGVDASPEAVAAAASAGRNVLLVDISAGLPFDDAHFNAVVLKDVLEHVQDPFRLVKEAWRVLDGGGRVFASSPDAQRWSWDDYTHRRPFTRRAYRLLFQDAGFRVEHLGYESVLPGTGVVSGWTRRKRRPVSLQALAWLPVVRRNVWLVGVKPSTAQSAATALA